jgi:hypothetical protein
MTYVDLDRPDIKPDYPNKLSQIFKPKKVVPEYYQLVKRQKNDKRFGCRLGGKYHYCWECPDKFANSLRCRTNLDSED